MNYLWNFLLVYFFPQIQDTIFHFLLDFFPRNIFTFFIVYPNLSNRPAPWHYVACVGKRHFVVVNANCKITPTRQINSKGGSPQLMSYTKAPPSGRGVVAKKTPTQDKRSQKGYCWSSTGYNLVSKHGLCGNLTSSLGSGLVTG